MLPAKVDNIFRRGEFHKADIWHPGALFLSAQKQGPFLDSPIQGPYS